MTIPVEVSQPIAPAEGPARPTKPVSLLDRLTDLGPRVLAAFILAVGAIVSLVSGGVVFLLVWLAAALVVPLEWQRLIGGSQPSLRIMVGSLAIVVAAILANANSIHFALLVLGLGALASAYLADEGRRGWSAAGIFYAGCLIVAVLALRLSFPFGPRAIGWLFAVVWGTDVVAYFAGRLIGGPRFVPQISPSKTWAGTLCGMVGGACLGSLFLILAAHVSQLETPAPLFVLFVLGLITSAVAQGGDLFESWTKRCFGAKDSGALIPGHGGLMDRLDGFIAAAIWVTIIGIMHGYPSPAEGLFHWM